MKRWIISPLFAALIATTAVSASAETPAETADRLFQEARGHMGKSDHRGAYPMLVESQRLDPQRNTLMNMAMCEEQLGHPALALQHWKEGIAGLPADDPRMPYATARVAELEKTVPRLTLTLPADAAPNTRVLLDEADVPLTMMGRELRVDPGPHRLRVDAEGRETSTQDLAVSPEETRVMTLTLGAAHQLVPLTPAPLPVPPERSFYDQHQGSLIAGGAAVVLAGVGGGLGFRTWRHYDDLAANCVAPCSQDEIDSVKSEALWTNIAFAAAGVAALTSVSLFFFVENEEGNVQVGASPGGGRLTVRY